MVVEVHPPEEEIGIYGQSMDGEAISVAFPNTLDEGPGDWREFHPALLASYCEDQSISLYTYKHTNLEFAEHPYTVGDRIIHTSHDDPDVAVIIDRGEEDAASVTVVYENQLGEADVHPQELATYCETEEITQYSYSIDEIELAE